MTGVNTTSTTVNDVVLTLSWKPVGRGRRFDRLQRGLARRLRNPIVRTVKWQQAHPDPQTSAATYGAPWISDHCLANFSFACTCHKRDRYSRKGRKR